MYRCPLRTRETVVEFLLLERLELGLELVLARNQQEVQRRRAARHATGPTSSTMLPIPTGLEIASEISFVRSICSRIESMVWSKGCGQQTRDT
jgi:hypothetical protein